MNDRIRSFVRMLMSAVIVVSSLGCARTEPGRAGEGTKYSKRGVEPVIRHNVPYVKRRSRSVVERDDALRVTFELVIFNPREVVDEKTLELYMPDSAAVDRFGMWVQGRYIEGEIAPRLKAERTFDEYSREKQVDPALLVWLRPGQLRARVFPIFPLSSTKLLISYVIPRHSDRAIPITDILPETELRRSGLDPLGAASVEPLQAIVNRAWAYRSDTDRPGYFAADLRLPRTGGNPPPPDLVLVLRDTSYSMRDDGRPHDILPKQNERGAPPRFQIDFDVFPRAARQTWPPQVKPAEFLEYDGASDVGRAFEAAAEFLAARDFKRAHLVLVSDGLDTCGEPNPRKWVESLAAFGPDRVRVFCEPVNAWLAAAFGLYHASQAGLADLRVTPVEGASDLGGAFLAEARPGGTIRVFGRYTDQRIRLELAWRTADGTSTSSIHDFMLDHDGDNIHLPRLWAKGRMDDLELQAMLTPEREARESIEAEALDIALDYQVLSKRASFLVLESERDFRESGVERRKRKEGWAETSTRSIRAAPVGANAWAPPSGAITLSIDTKNPHFLELPRAYRDILSSWHLRDHPPWARENDQSPYFHPLLPFQVGHLTSNQRGRYAPYPTQTFRTPPCGWVFGDGSSQRRKPGSEAAAWRKDFAPLGIGSSGWTIARRGDTTVLLRGEHRLTITAAGIETGLPALGLTYLNDPKSAVHACQLLDRFPFPTAFPIDYLAAHYDIEAHEVEGGIRITLARLGLVRAYTLDPETGLPSRILVMNLNSMSNSYELLCRVDGEHLVFSERGKSGEMRLEILKPLLAEAVFAEPHPSLRVGFIDYAPLWKSVLEGRADAGDYLQLALADSDEVGRLAYLGRAAELAPDSAVVLSFLAENASVLGLTEDALLAADKAEALIDRLPRRTAEGLRHFLAGVRSRAATGGRVLCGEDEETPIDSAFWPEPVRQSATATLAHEWSSPEVQRLVELVNTKQPEALAEHLLVNPGLLVSSGFLRKDTIYGNRAPEWSADEVRRFCGIMAEDAFARSRVTIWLTPYARNAVHWSIQQLRKRPDWEELVDLCLERSHHYDARDKRVTLLNLLDGPIFPPATRARARLLLLQDYHWLIDDLAGYSEEIVEIIGQIEEDFDRWMATVDLLSVQTRTLRRPALSTSDGARIIKATDSLPISRYGAYIGHIDTRMRSGPYHPWLSAISHHLIALAGEGRLDDALRLYEAHFSAHPRPEFEAYLREAAVEHIRLERKAELISGNHTRVCPMARAKQYAIRDCSVTELVDMLIADGGLPRQEIHREADKRGLGRKLTLESIRRFREAPHALSWAVFSTPMDEEVTREAVSAVKKLREELGIDLAFSSSLLRLCFTSGLLPEALEEAEAAGRVAPAIMWLSMIGRSIRSLADIEDRGLPDWRELMERLGSTSSAYFAAVQCLKAVRRYEEAFEIRKDAMAVATEGRPTGEEQLDGHVPWKWLEVVDQRLIDQVAVDRGERITLSSAEGFREELKTLAALARWDDYAGVLAENFGELDTAERLEVLGVLWLPQGCGDLRVRVPILEGWLREYISARRPLDREWASRLYPTRWIGDVDTALAYAALCAQEGWSDSAIRYANQAICIALNNWADDMVVHSFRTAVDDIGLPPSSMLNSIANLSGRSEKIESIVGEALFDYSRHLLESTSRFGPGRLPQSYRDRINEIPGLRRRVDTLARRHLEDGPNTSRTAVICALTGWGGIPEDACWEIVSRNPAGLVEYLELYLRYLERTGQTDRALEFLDLLDRQDNTRHQSMHRRVRLFRSAGRDEDAFEYATNCLLYEWLIEEGRDDLAEAAIVERLEIMRSLRVLGMDGSSYSRRYEREPITQLFAIKARDGRIEDAAALLLSNLEVYREAYEVWAVAHHAYFGELSLDDWKDWKPPEETQLGALRLSELLLEGDPGGWQVPLVVARIGILPAWYGSTIEIRASGWRLIEEAYVRLARTGATGIASDIPLGEALMSPGDIGWEDSLNERLRAAIAEVEARGRLFPKKGIQQGLLYDIRPSTWQEMAPGRRREMIRLTSRLLERFPVEAMTEDELEGAQSLRPPHIEDDPPPHQWWIIETLRRAGRLNEP